ncbi:uncharacterized protein L199_001077 [Kwoniella botswanensis]|uniref:uncharacterized protein n=1 Tax=Kwoniella botswanensis TaxID=1268659 RepID=UPI00315C8E05
MPPKLSDDIVLLIGQQLQSLNYHRTLSNLSLSCKSNHQLLTPLVYRHVILTDHSLPKLFTRIIDIPNGEKHAFMQPIKEEDDEEDGTPSSSLTPTRRLRVQLGMVFKMTVDTNDEQFPYEILTTIAKCLVFYFDDMLFPRTSRLVFTARHGTSGRIGLLSSDKDPYHLLRNFLPVACRPKYICCSFNSTTPACLNDDLVPYFTIMDEDGEVVNIHQARALCIPPRLFKSRISYSKAECPRGEDCTLQGHPEGCEKAEMRYRLTEILVGSAILTHTASTNSLEDSSTGAEDRRSDQNVTIVERTDQLGFRYHQMYKEMIEDVKKSTNTNSPFSPAIMQFLHSVAVNGGVMTGFGPNGPVVTPIGGFTNNGGNGNSNVGGSVNNNSGNNNNGNTTASSTSNGNTHANTASHSSTPNALASTHQNPSFIPGGAGLSLGLPNFTSMLNGNNNNGNNANTSNDNGTYSGVNTAGSQQNMANGNPAIPVNMSSMFNAFTSLPSNSSGPANGTGTASNSAGGNTGHRSQPGVPNISFAPVPTEMTPQDSAKLPSKANIRFMVGEAAERQPVCEACGGELLYVVRWM